MSVTLPIAAKPRVGELGVSCKPDSGCEQDQRDYPNLTGKDLGIATTGRSEVSPEVADGLLCGTARPEAAPPTGNPNSFIGMLWRLVMLSFLTGLAVSLGLGAAVTAIANSGAAATDQTLESPIDDQDLVPMPQPEPRRLIDTALPKGNQPSPAPKKG